MAKSPKNNKAEGELINYLAEHVRYEREMLSLTFSKIHTTAPGYEWNAFYESFGIHARNLYDFFRNSGSRQTTYRACDYAPNWGKSDAETKFNELDVFLFHMSMGRSDRQKINVERIQLYGKWLNEAWSEWYGELPETYKKNLSDGPLCVIPRDTVSSVNQFTACTVCVASTLTMSTLVGAELKSSWELGQGE